MLDHLDTIHQLLIALVILAAYVVRGITGFGSALVAVPLLALWLPLPLVVPIIVLLDNLGSLSHSVRHLHHIQWRDLLPLLPFTLTGVLSALYLLQTLDPGTLTTALGIFVIVYAVYSMLPLPELKGSRLWAVPCGLLMGLVGTLFGTGGPFTVIYLQLRQLEKMAFRGTIAMIFLIDGATRIIGFTLSGFYHANTLWMALTALPIMAIGLYAGGHIHTNLSPLAFKRIIAVLLIGSGTSLLLK